MSKQVALVQVDLETLSLHPTNAIVPAIAIHIAVLEQAGELVKLVKEFNATTYPSIDQQLGMGRQIDINTMLWWFKQEKVAQLDTFGPHTDGRGSDVKQALVDLTNIVAEQVGSAEVFWLASQPDLDITNLRSLFQQCETQPPFAHWQCHNQRTLRMMAFGEQKPERDEKAYPPHIAAADAKWQNMVLIQAMNTPGSKGAEALRTFFGLTGS